MPRLRLEWKAEAECIAEFHLKDDTPLTLTVQCTQCRQTHPRTISVSPLEEYPVPNSRGTANFVMKCTICQQHTSIVCETKELSKMVYKSGEDEAKSGEFQPMAILDIRGLDIEQTHMTGECIARSESGQEFEFELSEELADYDEKLQVPVSLSGFEARITKL